MFLNNKIKDARLEKMMTQKMLAKELTKYGFKTSNTAIANWEKGLNKPNADIISALCDILKKDINYFFNFYNTYNKKQIQEMNFSEKINILMKKNNIKNPKELSKKMNEKNLKIPYTTLLTITNNEVQDIKVSTAKKLSTFFNLTLDELLNDDIELANTASNSINTNGLDSDDINELNRLAEFLKSKKKKTQNNNE